AASGRRVPVLMAASGPKATELAGEIADGVLLSVGFHPRIVAAVLSHLAAGARRGGRRLEDLEVLWAVRAGIASSAAEARRQARPTVVHQALLSARSHWLPYTGLTLPRFDIPPAVRAIYPDLSHARDWEQAISATSFVPDDVIGELCDTFGLVGTAEHCAQRIIEMTSAGVTNLYVQAFQTFVGPQQEMQTFRDEHFSAERARELYAMYFDELVYCTETGFDGIMINEHHNNPLSMMPSVNVIGAVLARATRKGRIVFLGNVLPIHDNPLRVAEEVAMIDILSGGRVVCGFVRGLGQESLATNANPAYNRERFDEAHDVIVKAWTTPGPFCWVGRHYEYRVVNPWMRPLQKPHPPIWIPGVVSPESVRWAAEHRYPYVALAPPLDVIDEIYDLYDDVALETGFTPTAEHRGYVIRVSVADTDEEAYEQGRHFYWQLGTSFGIAPRQWLQPAGYVSH